jgi:hypothetical protein
MTRTASVGMGVLAAALAVACGQGPTGIDAEPGDAPSTRLDSDGAGAEPTAAERTACANIAAIAPCSVGLDDEATCLPYLADFRTTRAEPACIPQYDAWVGCLAALPECPGGSVLCPDEYTALGACVGPGL